MYTIIAYKSESSDYCRGCHMASYSSDFELLTDLTFDEAIQEYARFTELNGFLDYNETGYEITILEDGKHICSPDIADQGYSMGQAMIETRKQREAEYKLQEEAKSKAAELERKKKQLEALKKELGE